MHHNISISERQAKVTQILGDDLKNQEPLKVNLDGINDTQIIATRQFIEDCVRNDPRVVYALDDTGFETGHVTHYYEVSAKMRLVREEYRTEADEWRIEAKTPDTDWEEVTYAAGMWHSYLRITLSSLYITRYVAPPSEELTRHFAMIDPANRSASIPGLE